MALGVHFTLPSGIKRPGTLSRVLTLAPQLVTLFLPIYGLIVSSITLGDEISRDLHVDKAPTMAVLTIFVHLVPPAIALCATALMLNIAAKTWIW